MTRGAAPLTIKQKEIVKDHMSSMLPFNITKLEGMEGTTKRQVADYIRSLPEKVDDEMVVWAIETWIEKHGLKKEFGAVMGFLRDIKNRG